MRKETFQIGDFVHVFNRGNRKISIVHDDADKWRFLKILRYFNDEYFLDNMFRCVESEIKSGRCGNFERPQDWPRQKPLVKILSFCLMPNHYHLLLKEIIDNGISKFMHRLGVGFTNYINIKYDEVGSLFQGSYKAKIIKEEKYLQYVDAYIQVFNFFELYSGGLDTAMKEFDKAFDFVLESPFCSLGESFKKRNLHIINRDILGDTFKNIDQYRKFVHKAIIYHNIQKNIGDYIIE